jgi:tRNA(Ile)-lysidine synthetase-like protein
MRRNLFKRAMLSLRPGLRDVDYDVLDLAAQSSAVASSDRLISPSRRQDLTGGMYLYQEQDLLYIACDEADLPTGDWPLVNHIYEVHIGENNLENDWRLTIEKVNREIIDINFINNDDPFMAWMDADKVTGNLSVQSPHPGDSFKPLGMNGQTIKLSDFFVNIKLPKRARAKWPLLLVNNEIAWVMGLRLSHLFRLEETTTHTLCFTLRRLP